MSFIIGNSPGWCRTRQSWRKSKITRGAFKRGTRAFKRGPTRLRERFLMIHRTIVYYSTHPYYMYLICVYCRHASYASFETSTVYLIGKCVHHIIGKRVHHISCISLRSHAQLHSHCFWFMRFVKKNSQKYVLVRGGFIDRFVRDLL